MKTTINADQFCNAFDNYSDNYSEKFTYNGKVALYDYLHELETDLGEEIELDPIALCCEYTEYANLPELQENYTDIKTMQDLEEHTQVILIPDTERFIIQNY